MDSPKIIEFLHKAGKLKNTLRFQESQEMPKDTAASHSWRTALMSFILAGELGLNLDSEKVLKMAIVHDIVEAEVGNIDYISLAAGSISKTEQKRLEEKAINKLTQALPEISRKEIYNLWTEFDKGETKESKYVRAVNKLETLVYLLEVGYKHYSNPELIFDYLKSAAGEFPELKGIFAEVENELKKEVAKSEGYPISLKDDIPQR